MNHFVRSLLPLALGTLCGLLSLAASARTTPPNETNHDPSELLPVPEEPGGGLLVLHPSQHPDEELLAPQLANEVRISVTGLIATAEVTQVFENPTHDSVEATYVFPLPEHAAVYGLELHVGERVIVGEVQPKQQARDTFEAARAAGKRASLLEQSRPNLFSTRVTHVQPGEHVEVHIRYQQDVRYDDGAFSLHFPATLTPRYTPGSREPEAQEGEALAAQGQARSADVEPGAAHPHGWGPPLSEPPPAPPFSLTGEGPWLDMSVELDAGFDLRSVSSPSHAIFTHSGDGQAGSGPTTQVYLAHGPVLADRDFRLSWQPDVGKAPASALFQEEHRGQRYALLMLLPPSDLEPAERLPRHTTFVIDSSGSMAGTSMAQARHSLEVGLSALKPQDTFNVIEFDDEAHALFQAPHSATRENIEQALEWVHDLEADGGTEMLSALELALPAKNRSGEESVVGAPRVEQVVFITDGSVGNERQLFDFLQQRIGQHRLFTVGIGSAPNRYFMRGAARFGRGTFTQVSSLTEVGTQMNDLFRKIDAPVLTSLRAHVSGARAELYPQHTPDLYTGEPLIVLARLDDISNDVLVSVEGVRGSGKYQRSLRVPASAPVVEQTIQAAAPNGITRASTGSSASPATELGIHRLWARRKIEHLMDQAIGSPEGLVEQEVTALAVEHQLVSRFTSLVAVDTQRVAAEGTPAPHSIASAVPAGSQQFGVLPQTATEGPFCLRLGLLSLAFAGALSLWVRR